MSDQPGNETNAALSRLYREAASAEPPLALDRAILDAAAAAVASKPARGSAWWRRWSAPVAAFATIVLTISLSFMVRYEQERDEATVTSARTRADNGAVDQAKERRAAPASAPRAVVKALSPPAPSPSAFESKKEVAAEPAPKGRLEGRLESSDNAPALRAAPPGVSPMAPKSIMLRGSPVATPAQSSTAPASGELESPRMRSREDARDALQAPAENAARGADAASAAEAWLARIRELKRQGKEQEAKAALADFKRAYPDLRLPPDFQ